uniref:NADH-ubiquinone oxidoreductase chain 2 n=1 Tax=Japalura variegata TaxID=118211 RepID=Q9G653_9SAUR|nr:NADH dehydrogenase subunit 2 [Japalura variegata]
MLITTPIMLSMGIMAGTVIVMSSHHWLMAWAGLELNMLSILPIISKTKHPRSIEASTKYFLTQAIASCLMLAASITNAWQTGNWDITQMNDKYSSTVMVLALTMKAGAVPLHFWLPEVMQGSSLHTALLISTWQKIAPLTLLYSMSNHVQTPLILTLGALSTMFGGWGGMNQTQLRKMMAYSSITNLGWALMVLTSEPNMSAITITTYMLMTIPTFLLMVMMTTKTLQNMSTAWATSPTATTTLMILILSMAGLPPLTGFLPKLLILNELITQNLTPLATLVTLTSLLNLTFYLRVAYMTTLLNPPVSTSSMMKWRQSQNKTKPAMMAPTAVTTATAFPTIIP